MKWEQPYALSVILSGSNLRLNRRVVCQLGERRVIRKSSGKRGRRSFKQRPHFSSVN
jgi:hypothetical protein